MTTPQFHVQPQEITFIKKENRLEFQALENQEET